MRCYRNVSKRKNLNIMMIILEKYNGVDLRLMYQCINEIILATKDELFWIPCHPSIVERLYFLLLKALHFLLLKALSHQRKEKGKDQESIQSSTTPDPGHHMGK